MRSFVGPVLFVLWASPAHAACPSTVQDVLVNVNAAMSAYATMDALAYQAARAAAMADLACVREPLSPVDAAGLHRLSGLDAYVTDDRAVGTGAFRAALAIQPAFQLPSTMVPEGHPLREWYDAARVGGEGPDTVLVASPGTQIYVDGVPTTRVRAESATLLQWIDASGEVRETSYLAVGAPMPWWARPEVGALATTGVADAPRPMPVPTTNAPDASRPRNRVSAPLVGSAAVLGVGSGVMYALAANTHATWADPETPYDTLDRLRTTTNNETIGAAAAGALALTLGIAGFVTIRW